MSKAQVRGDPVLVRRLDGIERLAWWLDDGLPLPGTSWRIGWDAIIGLVPGIGDAIGLGLSGLIVLQAARAGVSRASLVRMVLNLAVDAAAGVIPLAGDVFDAGWKANRRNIELFRRAVEDPALSRRRDLGAVLAVAGAVILLVGGVLAAGVIVLAAVLQV
ncbi:MAG: DUF4112 domain-containing protein [Gemmatimonadales bacterium]